MLTTELTLAPFFTAHQLPAEFETTAKQWFYPVIEKLVTQQQTVKKPLMVGINGCQGSGKSTLAALICEYAKKAHQVSAVSISIDDFYLTHQERKLLAKSVHPLLQTRGVPGTHDVDLALKTLGLLHASNGSVDIPRFDKATDDRADKENWDKCDTPVELIMLEGWCVGATAQTEQQLQHPINSLEQTEDEQGTWRHFVNQQLQTNYPELFQQLDVLIMLKAPSFDNVFQWRSEQEHKLRIKLGSQASGKGLMNKAQLQRFIQHYERITQQCLDQLPTSADYVFELDSNRNIHRLCQRHDL